MRFFSLLLFLSLTLHQKQAFSNPYKVLFVLSSHGTKEESHLCAQQSGEKRSICEHDRKNEHILCEGTTIWPHLIATSSSCAAVVQHSLKSQKVFAYIPEHRDSHQHFQIFEASPLHQMGIGWVTLNHSYHIQCADFDFPYFEPIDTVGSQPLSPIKHTKFEASDFHHHIHLTYHNKNSYVSSLNLPNGTGVFSLETGRLIGVFSGYRDHLQNSIIHLLSGSDYKQRSIKTKLKHSVSSIQLGSPTKSAITKSPSNQSLKDHKKIHIRKNS